MITIRPLRPDDNFGDLIALSRVFFNEYEAYHEEFFKIDELEDEDVTAYFTSFCNQVSRQAYIAIAEDQIVGYITVYVKEQPDYWRIKKIGEISGLMVRHEYRQQGIGERLLAEAKAYFQARGVNYYSVYTSVENQAGLEFYRKNGLKPLLITMLGEAGNEERIAYDR